MTREQRPSPQLARRVAMRYTGELQLREPSPHRQCYLCRVVFRCGYMSDKCLPCDVCIAISTWARDLRPMCVVRYAKVAGTDLCGIRSLAEVGDQAFGFVHPDFSHIVYLTVAHGISLCYSYV